MLAERAGGRGANRRNGEGDAALGDLDLIEAQPFEVGQEAGGVEAHERTPGLGHQTARAVSPSYSAPHPESSNVCMSPFLSAEYSMEQARARRACLSSRGLIYLGVQLVRMDFSANTRVYV